MTGIEQLRKLGADAVSGGEVGRAICDIADQIERERECERDTIENLRLELGEARDEAAWVREHGGLERVKNLLDWVVGHCSTRQQLDFDFWLSGRVMHELGFEEDMADRDEVERRLLARLMPDGMEWPRFESGEPVRIGDVVSDVEVRSVVFRDDGILLSDCTSVPGWGTWRSYKEPIKRPAKVPDSEGVECNVGDAVWWVHNKTGNFRIIRIEQDGKCAIHDDDADEPCGMTVPSTELTHKRPVLDVDGVEIREGDTVWNVKTGREYVVVEPSYGKTVVVRLAKYDDAEGEQYAPDQLTHERPDGIWDGD